MSVYIDVFAAAEIALDTFVQEVEHVLGLTAKRIQESYSVCYELQDEQTVFIVSENLSLVNDGGNDFEDYNFSIGIEGFIQEPAKRISWQRKRAKDVFDGLKATDKYRLLMVYDVQKKLDEFIPVSQQQARSEYAFNAQELPASLRILLATDWPLDGIANEVGGILNVPVEVVSDNSKKGYIFQTLQARYTLTQYGIKYPYIIHVEGRISLPGERRYWQYENGRVLFEQLKKTGHYTLALVGEMKDQDRILDEYLSEGSQ
jgi:hypothetical protein